LKSVDSRRNKLRPAIVSSTIEKGIEEEKKKERIGEE
jgi:hypothetical protein